MPTRGVLCDGDLFLVESSDGFILAGEGWGMGPWTGTLHRVCRATDNRGASYWRAVLTAVCQHPLLLSLAG